MMSAFNTSDYRRRAFYGVVIAFLTISFIAATLIGVVVFLQGTSAALFSNPAQWLRQVDSSVAFDAATSAAELLAAILAIAITVVAIVVELAANRYSHRITSLFVREPVNIVVMGFFVIATIQSVWVPLTLGEATQSAILPNAGFLNSIVMVTISLIILLPYFAFVMSFLSPVNVIDKISKSAIQSLQINGGKPIGQAKSLFQQRIDELQDIARRAAEQTDRAVAMASINAMCNVLLTYQEVLPRMPAEWFKVSEEVSGDSDFVSLGKASLAEIEEDRTWTDVKVLRQYLNFVIGTGTKTRDTTYVIAINTKRIGIAAIGSRPELIELCTRCFNSYLRATINNKDQRTSYYIMNQYRQFAEELLQHGETAAVKNIALHFQFYGMMGFRMQMPFLLEVAAYDIAHLIERCSRSNSLVADNLLDLILDLDQEAKDDFNEETLLGVRRVQIQLAAHFLEIGDDSRAIRICNDLKSERPARLERIRTALLSDNRSQFWEFTDRGDNFQYLAPGLRRHLATIFDWVGEMRGPGGDGGLLQA